MFKPELRSLIYFVTVAQAGSYVEAAGRLHMSQPALWRQVKALEKSLGVNLFDRVGNGIVLSSQGAVLMFEAQRVINTSETFTVLAADLASGLTGVVRLGCFPVHVKYALAPIIGTFLKENSKIRMEFTGLGEGRRAEVARQLYSELREGSLDLAMAPGPRSGFDGFRVYDVAIVALLPSNHPERGHGYVSLSSLVDYDLLTTPVGYFTRTEVERAANKLGIGLKVAIESSNAEALVALGDHEVGVPIVAQDNVALDRSYRGEVLVAPDGPICTEVWLHWRRSQTSSAARAFAEYVQRGTEVLRVGFQRPAHKSAAASASSSHTTRPPESSTSRATRATGSVDGADSESASETG